jgi:hypothetical protein
MTAPLTLDDAGVLLADVMAALERLEDAEIPDRRDGDPLPRGVITCGQACRFVPSLLALLVHLYPQLSEDGVLESTIRNAAMAGASGAIQ